MTPSTPGLPVNHPRQKFTQTHLPQRRVVWMWFGAFPGAFGRGRAQPQCCVCVYVCTCTPLCVCAAVSARTIVCACCCVCGHAPLCVCAGTTVCVCMSLCPCVAICTSPGTATANSCRASREQPPCPLPAVFYHHLPRKGSCDALGRDEWRGDS